MLNRGTILSDRQIGDFDRFLLDGTDRAIAALEDIFGLDVDRSSSSIELASLVRSKFIRHLDDGGLYVSSCTLSGEIEGRLHLLLRAGDFRSLARVMRPVLDLLFLSNPEGDLEALDSSRPDWLAMDSGEAPDARHGDFHSEMMDLLGELGHVMAGLYSKALFTTFHVSTRHSRPVTEEDCDQPLSWLYRSDGGTDQLHVVIENHFVVDGSRIGIWCVISPDERSLDRLLGAAHRH